jgi:diguanylate cyclase (GGDEF)-like protein
VKRAVEQLLPSYFDLVKLLLPGCIGICVLDGDLEDTGFRGAFDPPAFSQWLRTLRPDLASTGEAGAARKRGPREFEIALGLFDSTGRLIAVLGLGLSESEARALGSTPGKALRRRLRPAIDCLHRELIGALGYDLATGLLTRGALEESHRTLSEAGKSECKTVLHLDIDRLHVINDVHGHQVGDAVILGIAQLLRPPLLPRGSQIARIAGDQFVIVLADCDAETAAEIATNLQQAVAHPPTSSIPSGIELTLSCGISTLTPGPAALKIALVSAEAACRAAKERGRNRVETYGFNDVSIIARHGDALLMLSLEDALKTDRFELYGQPIVPLSDPELPSGYEVLLRLRAEDGSMTPPDEFLPAAHRYQMMPAIDRWVLDHTLSLVETYASVLMRRQITVSVNVTGHSLADDRFVDYLLSRTRDSRFPARLLTIEITEQSAVRNMASAVRLMNRLREAGCGVALDDFGTGTNSLVYLRDLPVTRVKIDGSFVRDIGTNRRAESTLKSIVDLLRPFDVDIVAEYVENEIIIRKLRQLGIDYAQGFAFGRPGALAVAFEGLKSDESRRMRRIALEI